MITYESSEIVSYPDKTDSLLELQMSLDYKVSELSAINLHFVIFFLNDPSRCF